MARRHTFSSVSALLLTELTAKFAVAYAWDVAQDSTATPPAHRHTNLLCSALLGDPGSQIIVVFAQHSADDVFPNAACAACADGSFGMLMSCLPQMTLCASALELLPAAARVVRWDSPDDMHVVSVMTAAHFGCNDFCVCTVGEVDSVIVDTQFAGQVTYE